MTTVGVLHPGAMGASVIASAVAAGNRVLWASEGRSEATKLRAKDAGAEDCGSLAALCGESDVVISVCPPDQALSVANDVAACGFAGTYVDANAVSPSTGAEVAATVRGAGARAVDGGIVGPPAWNAGSTRMYVSGAGAEDVVALFEGGVLDVIRLDGPDQAASALKMAYAGWTKGSSALLLAIVAFAESAGVGDALRVEWDLSQPGVATRAERSAGGTAPKAWRFVGEMHEIAASLASAGLPDGFHGGAAELYAAMAGFKDAAEPPSLDEVVAALLDR